MSFKSELLLSRNWGIISPADQLCIQASRIACGGCGLGAKILLSCARLGFESFSFADGDVVELSNLNRQPFYANAIGMNKALALEQLLKGVNPTVKTSTSDKFVRDEEDFEKLLNGATVAINTIDIGGEYLEFNLVARRLGIPVVFPLNIGFAGAVLVFTPATPTLEEMFDIDPDAGTEAIRRKIMDGIVGNVIAQNRQLYLNDLLVRFQNRESGEWPCDPQVDIAAMITTALTVSTIYRLSTGKEVRQAPEIVSVDPFLLTGI